MLWRARIGAGEIAEQVAARMVAVGAVYPSDALVWVAANHEELARSSVETIRIVVDDEDLATYGVVLRGTVAESLGRSMSVPVEAAQMLVGMLDRQRV